MERSIKFDGGVGGRGGEWTTDTRFLQGRYFGIMVYVRELIPLK